MKTLASRISARVFSRLRRLPALRRTSGVLAVGVELDGDDFGEADGGFAGVGVVDDDLLAGLHVAEGDEGLRVLDAVPGGFAVADEVVEGVDVGFGFEEVGHRGARE